MSVNDLGGQFALDMQGIQRLKHSARQDPNAGLEEAARQFEALFLQMMIKSMREATPQSDLMNSQQTEFYTSLLDQQWSQHMAGQGIGLAEQLINQLEGRGMVPNQASAQSQFDELVAGIPRGTPRVLTGGLNVDGEASLAPDEHRFSEELDTGLPSHFLDELNARLPGETTNEAQVGQVTSGESTRSEHVQHFLDKLTAPAQVASRTTGVPAELILAQAALETGWGRHEIPTAQGANSYNLFGIKAGSQWQGKTTDVMTHEYIDGKRVRMTDTFRVYDSFEEAFTDYARLIGDNPRYAEVVTAPDAKQAAQALQRGGYATDPAYADKLVAIMDMLGPLEEHSLAQDRERVIPRDFAVGRTPGSIF
ncbi:hypothetical protein L861_04250 [Litchfieldella anticariensis FP35 = DSM 16096]|uniref:Peptidoglycan hydrolase FlgJ n=1 Tax=Litchfieldella anticariensis (strain DSM 16096 / CECT 5854 / CIP 108499 / LMG 22089 / FP35) TaxID=1121939 RepID=S2LIT7_LITA3|nr:flagellar assembly peptidoglycan hydrolase FlgJ [Halomonas anticariensis]EPC04541.1 hypothetical protein L861_04250 [Halomonas anticariensis FP35 = DSM 16096]